MKTISYGYALCADNEVIATYDEKVNISSDDLRLIMDYVRLNDYSSLLEELPEDLYMLFMAPAKEIAFKDTTPEMFEEHELVEVQMCKYLPVDLVNLFDLEEQVRIHRHCFEDIQECCDDVVSFESLEEAEDFLTDLENQEESFPAWAVAQYHLLRTERELENQVNPE